MPETSLDYFIDQLRLRFGDRLDQFLLPPPVFNDMQGQLIAVDLEAGTLQTRFPLFERYLNAYKTIQGGVLAAFIDNTLGPLSLLVAPPNVTRRLELTYSLPATLEMQTVQVTARFESREERRLLFSAWVSSPQGQRLARARAEHWIV